MDTKKLTRAPGQPPGALEVDPQAPASRISVVAYSPDDIRTEDQVTVERVAELVAEAPVAWVHVAGLGSAEVLQGLGKLFELHPLVLEDIVHTEQRPKLEEYEDYNFIVMRMVDGNDRPETEQLAIVLRRGCVLTFQEGAGDRLESVRSRIHRNMGRIRRAGADYLAYAILDTVIDHYMPLLDWYDDRIEIVEQQVVARPERALLGELYEIRHELLSLRRTILSMRDVTARLYREEVPLFAEDVAPYLRDCNDHTVRLLETLSLFRERITGLMDLYMSSVSHRMNEVMKLLTIIATIFIPLSFIASVYGMNFDTEISPWNMPELEWRWGYPFALSIMAAVAVTMLIYFRRKGWLGNQDFTRPLPPRRRD